MYIIEMRNQVSCILGWFFFFFNSPVKINQENMTIVQDDAIEEDELNVGSTGLYCVLLYLPQ